MFDPIVTATVTSVTPIIDQIAEILKEVHEQAPEVLELGIAKVRTQAELQIACMVLQWAAFLVAILLMSRVWKSWRIKNAKYQDWKAGSPRQSERPDQTSDAHDVWAVIAGIASGILLFIIAVQIGWYLPDQVSFILNARYYAVLELIHQIRG